MQASQLITTGTEHIASMNRYTFSMFLWDKVVPVILILKKQDKNLTSSFWLPALRYVHLDFLEHLQTSWVEF